MSFSFLSSTSVNIGTDLNSVSFYSTASTLSSHWPEFTSQSTGLQASQYTLLFIFSKMGFESKTNTFALFKIMPRQEKSEMFCFSFRAAWYLLDIYFLPQQEVLSLTVAQLIGLSVLIVFRRDYILYFLFSDGSNCDLQVSELSPCRHIQRQGKVRGDSRLLSDQLRLHRSCQ